MTRIRSGMTVHVIEKAERCTIHQRSLFAGRNVVHAEKARFRRSLQGNDSSRYLGSGRAASAGNHASDCIQEPSSALPHHFSGQVLEANLIRQVTKCLEILAISRRSAK